MAFELPVVSTDVFGMATLLDDGVTGWLTRCNDVRSLAATLHRVLSLTPHEREAVARRARADVVSRSGDRAYGALLAAALDRLMQNDADPLRDLTPHRPPNERTRA